jgi:hypothetical protein
MLPPAVGMKIAIPISDGWVSALFDVAGPRLLMDVAHTAKLQQGKCSGATTM